MFKGIQKSLLVTSLVLLPSFVFADVVSKKVQECVKTPGSTYETVEVSSEVISKNEDKGTQKTKICHKVYCHFSTGNDEGNIEDRTDRGAKIEAWDPNVCETVEDTRRVINPIGGLDGDGDGKVSGDVSVSTSGDGGYIIKYSGSVLVCKEGEERTACLKRYGIHIGSGEVTFVFSGSDENGRPILIAKTGGSIDGDVDITGGSRGQVTVDCYEYKRVGWKLWLGKDWVLREECEGLGLGTSGGVDVAIGGDIDLDGNIGLGSSRSRGRSRYVTYLYRGKKHRCAVGQSIQRCIGGRVDLDAVVDWDNCADCRSRWSSRSGNQGDSYSGIISATAQLAGAILPPVMMYKGMKVQANAYLGAQQAKWGAAATGFEQCQTMQTNYVNSTYAHLQANELPDRSVTPPGCNGYSLGQFAGNQGWDSNGQGGWGNTWGSAGYSNNFMASMNGPRGNFGLNYDVASMYGNPSAGLNFGGNFDLNSMLGLPRGGINFGVNGGSNMGWQTPGWNPNGRVGWNGQTSGPGGNWGGSGSWRGGGNWGGDPRWNANSNGTVPWQNNRGSYWNNGNSSVNGNSWASVNGSFQSNNQASQGGSYYQQMALQNSANRAGYNMNYNGGGSNYSRYAPGNVGLSLGANWGLSFK